MPWRRRALQATPPIAPPAPPNGAAGLSTHGHLRRDFGVFGNAPPQERVCLHGEAPRYPDAAPAARREHELVAVHER